MPIYKSLGQFSKECSGFQNSFRRSMFAGVNAAALATKRSVLASAASRKWPLKRSPGKRQPVVVVGYDIAAGRNNPTALVRLKNGYIYQFGADPHIIVPRKVTRRRQAAASRRGETLQQHAAVSTPYGAFAKVNHPGMKGRPFWHQGVAAARPITGRIFGVAVHRSLVESFKQK